MPGCNVVPLCCQEAWLDRQLLVLLHHLGDGFDDAVDVAAVECRDANAPGTDCVDSVFIAQAINLLCRQPGIGKHPALFHHETEVAVDAGGLELFDQLATHETDAFAHAGKLGIPQSEELG